MNFMKRALILVWSGLLFSHPQIVEAQAKPDKRLLQKISVQVAAKPIEEFLRELGEKNKLPVEFDPSVAAEGLNTAPFSLSADGVTLGSVIHLVCDSANLVATVEKGRLLVATREADEKNLIPREYPLAPLGGNIDPQSLALGLVGLTSGHWMVVDQEGGDIVAMSPQSFTIRQTRTVHAELQSLFDQMSSAATGRARILSAQDRAEQMIVRKLQTPAQIAAEKTTLPDLLEQLLKKNGVPFWIDLTSLADEGIDLTKLTSAADAKKIPIAKRLDAIAEEHKLSWRVADEVVQITSAVKAGEQLFCRVYDVSRAISPNRPLAVLQVQLESNKELGPWQINDGEGGSIMPFGSSLLIRQNAKAHAKIAKILN